MALHVAYGLRLAVERTIPGLLPSAIAGASDVGIRLKEWRSSWKFSESSPVRTPPSSLSATGHPNLRLGVSMDGNYFGFFYGDGARFAVERRGCEVWADWPEDYTLEDACTYLVGPVMGFVSRLRGTVCLHASAVVIGHHAVALAGPAGSGKSTMAAAFACAGFPVLSDDVVALTDKGAEFLVQPGYPRVNLWPDSVRALFGAHEALPRITPTWEKRYLPLGQNGHQFTSSPLSLEAIYILGGRDSALTGPLIEELSGKEAFMVLVANTYVNYLLDQNMRRREFDVLSRVITEIPVRRVRAPEATSAIFDLCEAVANDAKRVPPAVPANASSVRG